MGLLRSDPVNGQLPAHARALLNAIAGGESAGKYNIRYTPSGGAEFSDLTRHPGIFEKGPHGPSSAAGRYQFTKTTWDGLGGGDFGPANQDARAWQLAQQDYRSRTGGDLSADLQANGYTPAIQKALAPTWAALKSGFDGKAAEYGSSLARYTGGEAQAPGAAPAAPSVPAGAPVGLLGRAGAPMGDMASAGPPAMQNGQLAANAPAGLLGGAGAPMQMPPGTNPAPPPIVPEAPAGGMNMAGLGQLAQGLLSAAQPKQDQGLLALWQMAQQQGGQVHRPTRIGGLL